MTVSGVTPGTLYTCSESRRSVAAPVLAGEVMENRLGTRSEQP